MCDVEHRCRLFCALEYILNWRACFVYVDGFVYVVYWRQYNIIKLKKKSICNIFITGPEKDEVARAEGIDNIAMDDLGDSNWHLKRKEAGLDEDRLPDHLPGDKDHDESPGGSHTAEATIV